MSNAGSCIVLDDKIIQSSSEFNRLLGKQSLEALIESKRGEFQIDNGLGVRYITKSLE